MPVVPMLLLLLSHFSRVRLFMTPWTVAHQAPLFMGFLKQEYWSGLSITPPGDLPNPGVKPMSLAPPALAGRFFTTVPPGKTGLNRKRRVKTWLETQHLKKN